MTELEVARYALRTFDLHWPYGFMEEPFLGPLAHGTGNERCWIDGTCTAQCLRGDYGISRRDARNGAFLPAPSGHAAPHRACSCGIYGSLDLRCLLAQYPTDTAKIVAVIAAEGITIIGTRGLRTQYARVVAYGVGPHESRRRAARRQFKDAQEYDDIGEMLKAYNLPMGDTPASGFYGHSYWR